jgi:hypothetical protein
MSLEWIDERSSWRMRPMSHARRFDHTSALPSPTSTLTAFIVGLGPEAEGPIFVEGEFLDTVSGSPTPAPRSSCCGRPTEVPG